MIRTVWGEIKSPVAKSRLAETLVRNLVTEKKSRTSRSRSGTSE